MKIVTKLIQVDGEIKKWRKKPVLIKAVELKEKIKIKTREGELFGESGDFLIEGIEGEVYPCGRDIFFKTYQEDFNTKTTKEEYEREMNENLSLKAKEESWRNLFNCIRVSDIKAEGNFWATVQSLESQVEEK